ncbi:DMT family transporter [Paraburkholderia sacchari]|uniref:DMT family transporter n=1 Tax=Paraburkholderia sacchari TaxID=159450 RepID=UPI000542BAD4|nr:DMT family transporter [Paraburkholderia sacchari]NLP63278.1 DMT family transporter [Paraburkholderia sacchari]
MRKHVDGAAMAIMVTLCLIWGFQQVAIKAVAGDIAPMMQVGVRSGVAAVLVWLFNRFVTRERWVPGVALRSGLAVGVLFALEFLFVAEALRWTHASHVAVLLYTAPMFAAIGLHLKLPDERLAGLQWGGIGLAFAGIAVAFLGPTLLGEGHVAGPNWLLGDFMALCGGVAWGMSTVVVRTTRLSEAPPTQTLFYQLACAFFLLLPFAFAIGQTTFRSAPLALASLVFQSVAVAFVSYLTWFWLLRRYFAARLGVLSFMTPLFGVAMGVVLLGEHVDVAFLVGSALVLTGLLIVNGEAWLRQLFVRGARVEGGAGF